MEMNLILEYFFLTIVFFTLLYVGTKQKKTKGIIAVNDLRHLCKSEVEKKIYDGLQKRGVYVSPSIKFGYCTIPMALEPYKIAIFTYPHSKVALLKRLKLKQHELYLRSFGWKVLKFPQETIQKDVNEALNKITIQVKIRNV